MPCAISIFLDGTSKETRRLLASNWNWQLLPLWHVVGDLDLLISEGRAGEPLFAKCSLGCRMATRRPLPKVGQTLFKCVLRCNK